MAENVSWELTRDTLQPLIGAPKLTEKLLRKPPFRFLHDIISNLIKQQHFYEGLYTEDELDSSKITDRDGKVAFLQKMVTAVQHALGVQLAVRPLKVVSGLEPEATNGFLQALAQSVIQKCDSRAAVERTLKIKGDDGKKREEKKEEVKEKEKAPEKERPQAKDKDREKEKAREKEAEKEREKEKDKEKEKEREHRKEKERAHREQEKEKEKEKAKERPDVAAPAKEGEGKKGQRPKPEERAESSAPAPPQPAPAPPPPPAVSSPVTPQEAPRMERPSTARKPPPLVKSNVVESEATPVVRDKKDAAVPSGLIRDRRKAEPGGDSDEEPAPQFEPPEEATRFEEGAEGGGGYLSKKAAQAARLGERAGEGGAMAGGAPAPSTGIILSRAIGGGKKERETLQQEIAKLRENLQTLTKTTNPLGKAMDYIQEDIDSMQRELEMWKAEAKQQTVAWAEQQRLTEESLQPLFGQLHDLEASIADQIVKIHSVKASILRNDQTVDTLLQMVVGGGQGRSPT